MRERKGPEMEKTEKAVITVIGKDMVGILAKVANQCADRGR